MAYIDWLTTLPQRFQKDGYSGKAKDTVVRSKMDVGPDKLRRSHTAGVRPMEGDMAMTDAQLDDLIEFYETTLLGGSLRFDFPMPEDKTGATIIEARFTAPPSWGPWGSLWRVRIALELLP